MIYYGHSQSRGSEEAEQIRDTTRAGGRTGRKRSGTQPEHGVAEAGTEQGHSQSKGVSGPGHMRDIATAGVFGAVTDQGHSQSDGISAAVTD